MLAIVALGSGRQPIGGSSMLRFLGTLLVPFGRSPRWQFVFMFLFALAFFVPIADLVLRIVNVEAPEMLGALGKLVPGGFIGQGIAALIGFYFLLIAFANRLHDRGHTGFWVILWLLLFAFPIGLFMLPTIPPESLPMPIPPELMESSQVALPYVFGAVGLLWLWLFVFCLVMPGTHGRNWFGRDPSGDEVPKIEKA